MTAETLQPAAPLRAEAALVAAPSAAAPVAAPVAAPPVDVVARAYVPVALCRCGHEPDAHEHYRAGDDCGVCGPVRCRRYVPRTGRGARSVRRPRHD